MENKQPTPEQALNILFEITGQIKLTRQENAVVDAAFKALVPLVQPAQDSKGNDTNK